MLVNWSWAPIKSTSCVGERTSRLNSTWSSWLATTENRFYRSFVSPLPWDTRIAAHEISLSSRSWNIWKLIIKCPWAHILCKVIVYIAVSSLLLELKTINWMAFLLCAWKCLRIIVAHIRLDLRSFRSLAHAFQWNKHFILYEQCNIIEKFRRNIIYYNVQVSSFKFLTYLINWFSFLFITVLLC